MKKIFFSISVFLITQNIFAQNNVFGYGLKAGISVGKIEMLPPLENRTEHYGLGIVAGGSVQIPIHKKFKIQIESLYNLHLFSNEFKNTDLYTDAKKIDLSLHQVSVPVWLGYFIVPKWSINAGVSANYNFYFKEKASLDYGASPNTFYPTFNITDQITKFQPGVLAGTTFYVTDNISIDSRYHRMLTNSYKRPPGDNWTEYHHGFFQIALGYKFRNL